MVDLKKKKFTRLILQLSSLIFMSLNMLLYNNCTGQFEVSDNLSSIDSSVLKSSFECRNSADASNSGSHFLSKKQYMNTIEDLFGPQVLADASSGLSSLSNDFFDEELRNKISSLDSNSIQAYFVIAQLISKSIVSNTTRRNNVFGACSSLATISSACISAFINNYGIKILRRPLSSTEISFTNSIFSGAGTNNEKLEATLNYLLQSPFFIWKVELGNLATSDNFNLTEYESATKLSYGVTDSTPDDALLLAVKNGLFKTDLEIRTQAERLILSPRGKSKVSDLLLHWSLSENPQDLSSLPASLKTGINMSGLELAMVSETKQFIDHIVFQSNGTFQDLLKSNLSFASHTGLAKIYNHAPITLGNPEVITERRQGLLMRAPFMTWTGPRTNLIKRGVDFQKRILCNQIPSPNVDIADDRELDAFTPLQQLENTNRTNIDHQTKSPVCMSCHSAINPVGFAFEAFDSLGRIRNQEQVFDLNQSFYKYINVDSNSSISRPRSANIPIRDAYELIDYVAESSEGHECFVRNVHRFIAENPESSKDGCHLNNAFEKLANSNESIKSVILELILNNNLKRKISN